MNIITINGRLGIKGSNITFTKEDFYGLTVGSKITQVGDGRENGSIRTDNYEDSIEYVGSIVIQFDKKEKFYAFKVTDDSYIIYGDTGSEIFTEAVFSYKSRSSGSISSYMRFYKPQFKVYGTDKVLKP